ncbi:hypothetical protein C8R45DRAFT_1098756 [Mycena sanguinolenta]|nr:hypothetical protein C8R45DRAFT_1098756 [Mycena sanguinolenta]
MSQQLPRVEGPLFPSVCSLPPVLSIAALVAALSSRPSSPDTLSDDSPMPFVPSSPTSSADTSEDSPMPLAEPEPVKTQALIRTFDKGDAWLVLNSVIADPLSRSVYAMVCQNLLHLPVICDEHILPAVDYGVATYFFTPDIAAPFGRALRTISNIILSAANNKRLFFDDNGDHNTIQLTERDFDRLGYTLPFVTLLNDFDYDTFAMRRYATLDDARAVGRLLPELVRYYVFWIALCIHLSIEREKRGVACDLWNWGAPIGLEKAEFQHRVAARSFPFDAYASLRELMDDNAVFEYMENAASRLGLDTDYFATCRYGTNRCRAVTRSTSKASVLRTLLHGC